MSPTILILLIINLLLGINSKDSNREFMNVFVNSILSKNLNKNYNLKELKGLSPVQKAGGLLKDEFVQFLGTMYNYETKIDDSLYDLIEYIDQDCFDFLLNFFFNETDFIHDISKKVLHDGGLIQYSISTEEDCTQEDGVYILFTGEYNRTELRREEGVKSKEALFREANYVREEVCIFNQCKHLYKPFIEYLFNNQITALQSLFHWNNFKISGINFNGINDTEKVQKTKEEQEDEENERNYFYIVKIILIDIAIFLLVFSIVSWIMEASEKVFLTTYESDPINKDKEVEDKKEEKLVEEEKLFEENKIEEDYKSIFKKKSIHVAIRCKNKMVYKIFSSFDLVKNLSMLNKKKDNLHNQTSIISLSTIKLLTLFFIMLGENSYLILKYVENKMSILSFCKDPFFFPVKLGMNSYEAYKVICGILFGFKFMSFYYKYEDKSIKKKLVIFLTKPIPYIFMFYIIHFLFNYPIFSYAKSIFDDSRTSYLSSIMEQCLCQKSPLNLFKIFSIMRDYNSTEFNIGQFNGCSRPILFSISETFCFYIVLFFAIINIIFSRKQKNINIYYIIFLILNFILLFITYFITSEVNDLTDEYTISRLFGLSGSIATPHLFFPMYYIGFNIGIIYYYKENNDKLKPFMPFKYCFDIAEIANIKGRVKNLFMSIFLGLIIILSLSYTFLIYTMPEGEFLFTFNQRPISKFIFVYKGIMQGIAFSFFMLIYLCSDTSIFKTVLSSEFFNFFHKISFCLFISFISVLYFFHVIGIMEIYLRPFSIIANTVILFIVSIVISIIFSCFLFFPIRKLYLGITKSKGFEDDEDLKDE